MRSERVITTVDFHTGGQGMRLLTAGLPRLPGATMAEKRQYFQERFDDLRTALCMEPRGHRDMLMAVMTEPVSPGAAFGLLFMDPSGYLDSCGEATIGSTTVALETGLVTPAGPATPVVVDTVAGPVETVAHLDGGRVREVTMRMRPSYVVATDQQVKVEDVGEVPVDVVVGAGNVFGIVEASALGLEVRRDRVRDILQVGVALREAANDQLHLEVPDQGELRVGLVEIVEPAGPGGVLRNAVIWGAGAIDRAPCGTGTCARLALLHHRGELEVGETIVHEGILGTRFTGRVLEAAPAPTGQGILPEIGGTAYLTAMAQFLFDPEDPLRAGYLLDL
ncbi:MAG TPA: proline racemase family protein [Actinomycetota bacterium]|nr:proline racemase family protein [Actinomycetota bacterium]